MNSDTAEGIVWGILGGIVGNFIVTAFFSVDALLGVYLSTGQVSMALVERELFLLTASILLLCLLPSFMRMRTDTRDTPPNKRNKRYKRYNPKKQNVDL